MAAARGSAPRPACPAGAPHLTIVPAAEAAAAAAARAPARWHWDEKKEGRAAGGRAAESAGHAGSYSRAGGGLGGRRAGAAVTCSGPAPACPPPAGPCPPPDPGAPGPLAEKRSGGGAPGAGGNGSRDQPGPSRGASPRPPSPHERFAASGRRSGVGVERFASFTCVFPPERVRIVTIRGPFGRSPTLCDSFRSFCS